MQLKRGFLVVVSGPGGVGKNTLVNAVRRRMPELLYSVSVTTRPPRPGELHGRDYFFVTPERFTQLVQAGELLEWARFGDHWYGTPARYVSEAVAAGRIVLLDIDVQGARQLRESRRLDAVFVFLLPPSLEALRERLLRRA
ncbi:MAG TPA: guanylate kinase, partial [Limnochordales bacterium]